jgi:hypothetical protein
MAAAKAEGRSFRGNLQQTIEVDLPGAANAHGSSENTLQREVYVRFHFDRARAGSGDSTIVPAILDSLIAVMSSPHGRQVVDTRPLYGARFTLTYALAGGPPAWSAAPPAADFGDMMGGAFPVSALVDHAFLPLPDKAVATRGSWERQWTRRQVDGNVPTESRVNSRFTLGRTEQREGVRVARVTVTSQGQLTLAGGGAWPRAGQVEATGWILVGVEDGIVREVSLEETATGWVAMGDQQLPFRQKATIRLTLVNGK